MTSDEFKKTNRWRVANSFGLVKCGTCRHHIKVFTSYCHDTLSGPRRIGEMRQRCIACNVRGFYTRHDYTCDGWERS